MTSALKFAQTRVYSHLECDEMEDRKSMSRGFSFSFFAFGLQRCTLNAPLNYQNMFLCIFQRVILRIHLMTGYLFTQTFYINFTNKNFISLSKTIWLSLTKIVCTQRNSKIVSLKLVFSERFLF